MENMCKKECKTYKKWIKGINTSLSPFAVRYFEFDSKTQNRPLSYKKLQLSTRKH